MTVARRLGTGKGKENRLTSYKILTLQINIVTTLKVAKDLILEDSKNVICVVLESLLGDVDDAAW